MNKRQHGFSGHLGPLAALSSFPGDKPTQDDDATSIDFSRWQACCPLPTKGTVSFPASGVLLGKEKMKNLQISC